MTDTIASSRNTTPEHGVDRAPLDRSTRLWLAALVVAGLAARLVYLAFVLNHPGFEWSDPDGFAELGHEMVRGGWHWTDDAVIFYQFVKAPLYPVLLSFAALAPPYPLSAAIGQALLNAVGGTLAIFSMGRTLHSTRTGVLAAAAYALVGQNVTSVNSFMQESVVVPLTLIAFAALLETMRSNGGPRRFALAGLLFGIAALVRSMPLYFVPLAALAQLLPRPTRSGAVAAAALAGTFLATIVPYSAYISLRQHRPVLIDNQGARYIVLHYSDNPEEDVPGVAGSVRLLWRAFSREPAAFVRDRVDVVRSFFLLRGGRWLQTDRPASPSRGIALLKKTLVHGSMDLPVALAVLLAPFGFVLARNRPASALLVVWVLLNLALMTTFLWGSARYRAAFEAQLIAGAAVVVAGRWRRPAWWESSAAGLATVLLAIALVPSIPVSLRGFGDYGVSRWIESDTHRDATITGRAGFNVLSQRRMLRLSLRAARAGQPADVEITADGQRLWHGRLPPGAPLDIRYRWPSPRLVFLEIEARDARTQSPATLDVDLPLIPPDPEKVKPY